jgi:hypothetical protein
MTYKIQLINEGAYNFIYKISNPDNTVIGIFKLQKPPEKVAHTILEEEEIHQDLSMDTIERSVRIWNEINPALPAKPFEVTIKGVLRSGWLCPYIEGRQANDKEITNTLIDIYRRTGRIVVDAIGHKNVLTQSNGRSVCVDIGFALHLDYEYGPLPRIRDRTTQRNRSGSTASVTQWRYLQDKFTYFFSNQSYQYTLATAVTQALLFLNKHTPDLRDVGFLTDMNISGALAQAYRKELYAPTESHELVSKALELLEPHRYSSSACSMSL